VHCQFNGTKSATNSDDDDDEDVDDMGMCV